MTVLFEGYDPLIQQQALNTNKAVTLGSTLAVTGATTLSSTLAVTGAVTFSSTISVGAITGTTFSGTTVSGTGLITATSATPPTAGATQGFHMGDSTGPGLYYGVGVPTASAATGSLYINYTGTASTRLYIASSATGGWGAITAAA